MAGFSGITWTNGVTAVNQTNMQRYETFIEQLEGDTGSVSATGTTSGTATLYQVLQGTVKAFLLKLDNYRNASATEQTLTLPVAFIFKALYIAGNTQSINFYISGSPITGQASSVDGLNSSGGTTSTYNAAHQLDFGEFNTAFDAIGLGTSQSSAYTGLVFMIGI